MAGKTTQKKHKCEPCQKLHVEDLSTYGVQGFTYRNVEGNIFIDAYSVFAMLRKMSLNKQALEFMDRVAECRKKE